MNICSSCKNRTSLDRCDRKSIKGLDVCGIHAKAKNRRNWYTLNNLDTKISKIQAVWRGYDTRNTLKRAGPGVLKRSICHNEEELVSLEPISKLHPFSYISFEEDGKVWAFDTQSIFKILIYNVIIQNPYTRTPISNDSRRRIRDYFFSTTRRRICPIQIPQSEFMMCRLNLLTQIIHENGFEDFKPEYLSSLSQDQANVMRALLLYDMRALTFHKFAIRRHHYSALLNNRTFMITSHSRIQLITILCIILTDIRNLTHEYEVCFLIMSALYRV